MLVLFIPNGEKLFLETADGGGFLTVLEVRPKGIRIGLELPKSVRILRERVVNQIKIEKESQDVSEGQTSGNEGTGPTGTIVEGTGG